MIQRYDLIGEYDPQMVEFEDGDWVKWEDVLELLNNMGISYSENSGVRSSHKV